MKDSHLCQDIQRMIGASFICSERGDYLRIRTPFLFPDGDNIDLFCKVRGDVVTVSDLAETTGWLRMQSTALRRSPKQKQFIEDACLTRATFKRCGNREKATLTFHYIVPNKTAR